eukprot:1182755-Prorocentrum_minimum.AAC.4
MTSLSHVSESVTVYAHAPQCISVSRTSIDSSRVPGPCGAHAGGRCAHAEHRSRETGIAPASLTGVLAGTFPSLAFCTPTLIFQSVSAEARTRVLYTYPTTPLILPRLSHPAGLQAGPLSPPISELVSPRPPLFPPVTAPDDLPCVVDGAVGAEGDPNDRAQPARLGGQGGS